MPKELARFLATFFYLGYFPMASGTFASAFAVGLCYLLKDRPALFFLVFLFVTITGFIASDVVEKAVGKKDPSCVVIDEVSGMMIALFMLPWTPAVVVTAFFLFRAFDMFKIYPMNKLEALGGGKGIMLDDIFAGIYTNLTMRIALFLSVQIS